MRTCSACGSEIEPGDDYCSECGADLSKPDAVSLDLDSGEVKKRLQGMDELDFEHFVADLWEEMGWSTGVTQASSDAGIDVVAEKQKPYPQKQLIQIKRYTEGNTISSSEVQQYAALKQQHRDVDVSVIVTSSSFSSEAQERGQELNVKLVDGDQLVGIIDDLDAYDVLEEYVDFPRATEPVQESFTVEISPSVDIAPQSGQVRGGGALPDTGWHKGVMAGTAGWIIILFGINSIPDALGGLLILISWFLLPVAIYKDVQAIQDYINWPKYKWAYIITSIFWIVAIISGLVYLWKRRKISSSSTADQKRGQETTRTREDRVSGSQSESLDAGLSEDSWLEYGGDRFHCDTTESSNGVWKAVRGRSLDSGEYRVFLYEDDDLRFTKELDSFQSVDPTCAVADTGRVALIDGLDNEELSGKLYVFSPSGEEELTHFFNSNVAACTITSDGSHAAVATLNPDCSTYIFDLDKGEQILKYENQEGNKMGLEFRKEDGETWLYLSSSRDSDPLYAIDLGGAVVWKSEELQRRERLQELMNSSDTDDLEEALELLEEAYELAEEENERKNVARKLADTHWSLARELEYDTDPWWRHLNEAKTYYMEILPWYDGKQGVAKVSRKQGKYHLDQGNEDTALELFQSIADLEEQYDVQLLTDADKRRLEELS